MASAAVQEALGEALSWAWEHADRLATMDNPGGYLYRVGQSRSRPHRQAAAFPSPGTVGLPEIEPALPAARNELTERQRVCLALVVVDEWTYREVADLLGVRRSAVQAHVERALTKLRDAIGMIDQAEP